VAAFLAGRIGWATIAEVVADTLSACDRAEAIDAEDVVDADRRARERAERSVRQRERAA
jgi:1-deoxy-D-xylulose 5-phosphate reductoisomerase